MKNITKWRCKCGVLNEAEHNLCIDCGKPKLEHIDFDEAKYKKLKAEYKQAKLKGLKIFIFEEKEILTKYAKYLLQYLATHFEVAKR